MAITISFGIQKGGVGKTTTTAITAYLLAKENRVLAVDFDSQGNMTQMLTGERDIYKFTDKTVLAAIEQNNAKKYIYKVNENLHVLPAEDALAILPNRLASMYRNRSDQLHALRKILSTVQNDYDYILIDLPPNLGDHTLCGLVASDFAVVILQTDPFSFNALGRYIQTLRMAKSNFSLDLRLAGILACMMNSQMSLDKGIYNKASDEYSNAMFSTVIKRKSKIKEFSIKGISEKYKDEKMALSAYVDFTKELIDRVNR